MLPTLTLARPSSSATTSCRSYHSEDVEECSITYVKHGRFGCILLSVLYTNFVCIIKVSAHMSGWLLS